MLQVLLVVHLLIALALVGVILLQRSEGGALGIGGGGGMMTSRAAGNLLTRTTAILATGFFVTSLGLALIANSRGQAGSIMDVTPATSTPGAPAKPAAPAPEVPTAPTAPISR